MKSLLLHTTGLFIFSGMILCADPLIFEVEEMGIQSSKIVNTYVDKNASGERKEWQRFRGRTPGDFLTYTFQLPETGEYRLHLRACLHETGAIWKVMLKDEVIATDLDFYAAEPEWMTLDLGIHSFGEGQTTLRFEIIGVNPAHDSEKRQGRFDFLSLTPVQEPAE